MTNDNKQKGLARFTPRVNMSERVDTTEFSHGMREFCINSDDGLPQAQVTCEAKGILPEAVDEGHR